MISVIVPVYNTEKYLRRCIDSILAQTYKDFELILIDDGSTDNSGLICDEYEKNYNRIRVIHQQNSGVSVARNEGVKVSEGNYIVFIDSDDWISADYLSNLYLACKKNNAQIAFCDYAIANDITSYEIYNSIEESIQVFSGHDAVQFYAEKTLDKGMAHFRSPWAKILKKEIALKHPFPSDRVYAEDAACVYLWLWEANRVVHINDCGYFYFRNPDGICQRPIGEFYIGVFMSEDEILKFFKKYHYESLVIKASKRYIRNGVSTYKKVYKDKANRKIFRKTLRYGLRKYAKPAGISIRNNSGEYDLAYPIFMKFFRYCYALKLKLIGKR